MIKFIYSSSLILLLSPHPKGCSFLLQRSTRCNRRYGHYHGHCELNLRRNKSIGSSLDDLASSSSFGQMWIPGDGILLEDVLTKIRHWLLWEISSWYLPLSSNSRSAHLRPCIMHVLWWQELCKRMFRQSSLDFRCRLNSLENLHLHSLSIFFPEKWSTYYSHYHR